MRLQASDVDVCGVSTTASAAATTDDAVVGALLFSGGRSWVATRAEGCVLEVAVGTGRNLSLYPRASDLRARCVQSE